MTVKQRERQIRAYSGEKTPGLNVYDKGLRMFPFLKKSKGRKGKSKSEGCAHMHKYFRKVGTRP